MRQALTTAIADGVPSAAVEVIDADLAASGEAAIVLFLYQPDGLRRPALGFCERQADATWWLLAEADGLQSGTNALAGAHVAYASGRTSAQRIRAELNGLERMRRVIDGFFVVAFWSPDDLLRAPAVTELDG